MAQNLCDPPWSALVLHLIAGKPCLVMNNTNLNRRRLMKSAGIALALAPLIAVTREARASSDPAMRAKVKYQDFPMEGKNCSSCLEFIPGKSDKDLGRCKVIPDDDEISPNGYCSLWNTM